MLATATNCVLATAIEPASRRSVTVFWGFRDEGRTPRRRFLSAHLGVWDKRALLHISSFLIFAQNIKCTPKRRVDRMPGRGVAWESSFRAFEAFPPSLRPVIYEQAGGC